MPPQADRATESEQGAGGALSFGGPILAVGAFAAGAALTLLAKRLIDARRKGGSVADRLDVRSDGSNEDLATVLRRAALDVAVAASGQAADRLRSRNGEPEAEPEAEPATSSTG